MASVPRQNPKASKGTLDPRATRYGLVPIWDQSVAARDFYTWTIQANKLFPFRPFIGEIGQDVKGQELYRVERMPADQVLDLQRITAFFVELPELAKLDEEKVEFLSTILLNPNTCKKYGMELGNECASCWLEYIHNELPDRIKNELSGDKEMQRAANASIPVLKGAIEKAINEARRLVDEAIREIDDPTKGKKQFYDIDYLNIYHTHADRPKYKTQTSNSDSIQALADILVAKQAPAIDPASIAEMVAKAVEAATAPLKEELAKYKEAPAPKAKKEKED